MCSAGKCCCLKLETGTLIFGVIASIFNSVAILACIGGLIAVNIAAYEYTPRENIEYGFGGNRFNVGYSGPSRVPPAALIGVNVGLVFALLKSVMNFSFSVLLCTGVNNNKPSHVKAYFIYGIVMAVLISLGFLVFVLVTELPMLLLVVVIIIGLYGLILHMIRLTYEKMSSGEVYEFAHKRLQETC